MQKLGAFVVGGFVVHFFAVAAAGDESGAFELLEMMADGGTAHVDHCGNIYDALFTMAEKPEDADAVAVSELFEDVGDELKMVVGRHVFKQLIGE